MTISFNQIPSTGRVPFAYVEIDPSQAQQGPSLIPFRGLIVGLRTSAGTVAEAVKKRITSAAQAAEYWGAGSVMHAMAAAWFRQNRSTELWGIALDEPSGGDAAAGAAFTITGTPTANGTLHLYVAGRYVPVTVSTGDANTAIASAIHAAINALEDAPVTASITTNQVSLTCRHKGEVGNQLDVRKNYLEGQDDVPGVTVAVNEPSGGTGAPDLDDLWAVLGDEKYNVIASAFTDATNLGKLDLELESRWSPERAIAGVALHGLEATHSAALTIGDGLNSQHLSILPYDDAPTPPWEWGAAAAAVVARYGEADPARPFQTLPLIGVLPPASADVFTHQEQELLLLDGMSTFAVDSQGRARVGRLITTYQENDAGFADTAFLDVNPGLVLDYLRTDWAMFWQAKYGRHKLRDDGDRLPAGQAIMTPSLARAEAIARFRAWEDLGLVEGVEQFKRDLIVERSTTDPNRLDMLLPPDLVNQLRVTGTKIAFRL